MSKFNFKGLALAVLFLSLVGESALATYVPPTPVTNIITSVSPADGSTVSGIINISVQTSPNYPGTLYCMSAMQIGVSYPWSESDCLQPFSLSVDTRRFPNGSVALGIRIMDLNNNYQEVVINLNVVNSNNVYDSTPPVAILSQPAVATYYYTNSYGVTSVGYYSFVPTTGKFTVGIDATDNSGEIAKVQFFVADRSDITIEVDTPPFTIELDATELSLADPSGTVVVAIAYDKAGNKNTNWSYRNIGFTDDPALLNLQAQADASQTSSTTVTSPTPSGSKSKGKK